MGERSRTVAQRGMERQRRRAAEEAGRPLIGVGCLFCRETDRTFKSVEHILPESLGNKEWTLPAGIVCDQCNNGPLAAAEQDLCEFFPIKAVRAMAATKSKRGRYPEFKFGAGTMQHDGETLTININDAHGSETLKETGRVGSAVRLNTNFTSDKPVPERTTRRVAASMLKAALETAVNECPELAYSPKLDYVRRRALGEHWSGMVMVTRNHGPLTPDVRLRYEFTFNSEKVGMWVSLDFHGLLLVTHSYVPKPKSHVQADKVLVFRFGAAGA